MIYRKFQDLQLSALGMGTMRLPTINGDDSKIDEKAAFEMIDYAFEHGVNYFDTAWGYHSGNSELVVGKALKHLPRDKYYLATKFPGYDLNNMPHVKEIFAKQLEKLQVDYFDFYLIHNVCELNIEQYLDDKKYGVYSHLIEQKRNGKIKHLGFSAHGRYNVVKRFLEAYGKDMEFCQLQINYLDWEFQGVNKVVELLKEYNIPVWVMEPLRGGKLCNLPAPYAEKVMALRPGETQTAIAFRYLQSLKEVVVTLSGMSNFEQVKQNIATYETEAPLNESQIKELYKIAKEMVNPASLPCTACRYCTSHCPQQLDIPTLLGFYNEHKFSGGGFLAPMALASFPEDKKPSACIDCRSCEAVCPQQIKISEAMADFVKILG